MPENAGPRQLRRLLAAVMSLGADLDLSVVLRRIVEAGQELVGARFAALGVLDPTHTHLATDIDEELATALAAAAAIAIDNTRLHERSQELSLAADRERLGRDLHDTVIQRVFSTGLAMHTTARLCHDPETHARIIAHIDELDEVVRQLRSTIFQLDIRGPSGIGLREQILRVATESSRALGFEPMVHLEGPIDSATTDAHAEHLLAVLREALSNVARHAHATSVDVAVEVTSDMLSATATDDGVGLPKDAQAGSGLVNIRQRAAALGGSATIGPAGERGTTVQWAVPMENLVDSRA